MKKSGYTYFNGLLMLIIGTAALAYNGYLHWVSPEKYSMPLKIVVLVASVYAIIRGVYILKTGK